MAKKVIKAICDVSNGNQNMSTVRFAVLDGNKTVTPQPGQPPQRVAKTVVNITFADNKAFKDFDPGKEYTITIDG